MLESVLLPAYPAPQNGVDGNEKGRVDESMNVRNAARGSTGGVDEQSMMVPNAARGSGRSR